MLQPRLGDEGLERFEPPHQTNNYDINGLYLDSPNKQQNLQQDLLPTVIKHLLLLLPLTLPPILLLLPLLLLPLPLSTKSRSLALRQYVRSAQSFLVMTLVAVLLTLISVGGGLATRFVMENKLKNENVGAATALS
jgi:hypothetical protein